jgi:hypothetical protein
MTTHEAERAETRAEAGAAFTAAAATRVGDARARALAELAASGLYVVIPFSAAARKKWKAMHVARGVDLDLAAREAEAVGYFHSTRCAAIAHVCKKLGFSESESTELLREVVSGDL